MHVKPGSMESNCPGPEPSADSIDEGMEVLGVVGYRRRGSNTYFKAILHPGTERRWFPETHFSRGCFQGPHGHIYLFKQEQDALMRLRSHENRQVQRTQAQYDDDDKDISREEEKIRKSDSQLLWRPKSARVAAANPVVPEEVKRATHDELGDVEEAEEAHARRFLATHGNPAGNSDDPALVPAVCDKGFNECYVPAQGPNRERISCTT